MTDRACSDVPDSALRAGMSVLPDGSCSGRRGGARALCIALLGLPILLASQTAQALAADKPLTSCLVDAWEETAGLPQRSVTAILQTTDGFLWIGTKGGLARFDGVSFDVFDDTEPNQLQEREVWALAEDRDGSLWIGTYGGGINRFANGRFAHYSVKDGLPSAFVTSLAVARDGTLWVGTLEGLARRQPDGHFVPHTMAQGLPSNRISSLHVDQSGALWIGTQRGLASYANGHLTNHARTHPELAGPIAAMTGGGNDPLWVGIWEATSGFGLRRYGDGSVASFTTKDGLLSDSVTSLRRDSHGTLWIGTLGGLCRLRHDHIDCYHTNRTAMMERDPEAPVSIQDVQALTFDREGSLWVGTRFGGLLRLKDSLFSLVAGNEDHGHNPDVRSVFQDNEGAIWLAAANGVTRLAGENRRFYPLPHGVSALAVGQDAQGRLWVGTEEGLFHLTDGRLAARGSSEIDRQYVSSLLGDSRGNLWVGTRANGLFRRGADGVVHYAPRNGLRGEHVRALAEDRSGAIWVGTKDGGVACIRDGKLTTYGVAQGLASEAVQAVIVDSTNQVWAGTRRGLARIARGRVAMVTTQNGLPANYFFQIVEDDQQHLWLNFGSGVARVAKADLNRVADGSAQRVAVRVFRSTSGIRSTVMTVPNQPVAQKTRDGRIWFPTAYGAAVVDPSAIVVNSVPPPVHIQRVLSDNAPQTVNGRIELPPGRGDIEIHYTGLSFLAPAEVRFRYILEGFSREWVDAGSRRVAYFTNVPPGRYTFRVNAANNDGVWNDRAASLVLHLRPHFYQTSWFMVLTGLALIVAILAVHRLRVRRHIRATQEMEKHVARRTAALNDLNANLERRVAERTSELESEKERLAVTLRSIGDGVIAADIEGRVGLMNRVAEQLTGWSFDEARNRPLSEVLAVVDRETRKPIPDLGEGVRTRPPHTIQELAPGSLLVRRDGNEVQIADSVAPIRDRESRVVGVVVVFRDVGERLRMEEQIQNTQKLEALGILAGGIAHDFNNLLTGVFGHVDLARRHCPEPQGAPDSLRKALSVLEKARGLTGQLLTFSQAGQPEQAPLALGSLIEESVRFALSGSNVTCDVAIPPDLWLCQGDARQIDQLIDNLLLNARQAMPRGGTIHIAATNVLVPSEVRAPVAPGRYVKVAISDEGEGIPAEHRGRIFEPFFTTKPTGTGLGLATSYSIARRHGGHIELDQACSGPGACFAVVLPASEEQAVLAVPPEIVPIRGQGRILVLDDEDYVCEVAQEMLEDLGYTVSTAASAPEAVEAVRDALASSQPFDLAILDLTIPGGPGGVEVLVELRALQPNLRAVASSGYSIDQAMEDPQSYGFDARLRKPYTTAELSEVVTRTLAGPTREGPGSRKER
jgi:PAS domain S-box-containing protein